MSAKSRRPNRSYLESIVLIWLLCFYYWSEPSPIRKKSNKKVSFFLPVMLYQEKLEVLLINFFSHMYKKKLILRKLDVTWLFTMHRIANCGWIKGGTSNLPTVRLISKTFVFKTFIKLLTQIFPNTIPYYACT